MGDFPADFRSDTTTRPGADMRAAMASARVGDDVYGDDPTVAALEERLADLVGKQAAMFVPSGTQANLCSLLTHLGRGEEVLTGSKYHIMRYEAGGASVLGGAVLTALPVDSQGALDPDDIRAAIKPDDSHHARTRLLALENTVYGSAQTLASLTRAVAVARSAGLACHLDGARLFNAVIATGTGPAEFAAPFDTVCLSLSKGLGAPVGSVLTGPADFITAARRWRKMLGGGMRQSGILAAAGLYALDHHFDRLAEDHERAARLASQINSLPGLSARAATNMVFAEMDWQAAAGLTAGLAEDGILANPPDRIQANGKPRAQFRLVVHLDIGDGELDRLVASLKRYLSG